MLMFSRTLLFRQILSVKYALFTDKFGLGDCLHNLFSSAVTYQ